MTQEGNGFPEISLLLSLSDEFDITVNELLSAERLVPSFMEYTVGMHIITTRYLKCPHCGKKSWCKKILSKE